MPRTSPRPRAQPRRTGPVEALGAKGRRTKTRILEEARRLMLTKGYDATTIEDITEASGVGRASFYTYFKSKQDVLMAIGVDAEEAGKAAAQRLHRLTRKSTLDDVAKWVEDYLAFWDEHGPFVYAAYQASYADPQLRDWSINSEMTGAKIIGEALVHLRGKNYPPGVDPLIEGLALQSMIERFWYHWRVAGAPVQQDRITRSIAHLIWASVRA
jgi:AcrR family transcriptional regulator